MKCKEIRGTCEKYCAGQDGEIYCYSKARNNAKKPYPFALLKGVGSNGYYFVSIVLDGIRKSKRVHSLVCRAWNGRKPQGKICVRHLDGDKLNNKPKNLRWGTYYQNEADKRKHGRTAIGEKQGSAKLTDEAVRILRKAIPLGLWNEDDAGKLFNITPIRIRDIVRGRDWKHIK